MHQSVVSIRGQTVIPQPIRKELGIKPSTRLAWTSQDGVIIVVPIPADPVKASFGMLAGKGYTFENFMEERRREREVERRQDDVLDRAMSRSRRKRKA